jgi:microcystin-dependent protein
MGRDNMGGLAANRITTEDATLLGHAFGSEEHLLTGQESGVQDHRHTVRGAELPRAAGGGTGLVNFTGSDKTGQSDLSGNIDATEAHNNLQPNAVCNWIIRYV